MAIDENGYEVAKRCSCFMQERAIRRLEFANIPKIYMGMKLTNYLWDVYKSQSNRELAKMIKKVGANYITDFERMKEEGRGLYLYSEAKGSGKTRFAASIGNELIAQGVRTKFATSMAIINEIRKSWGTESKFTESDLLTSLISVDLLIIDDFGVEQVKDWINEKFYHIVNERYINKRPTIFTSNNSLNNINYDDRITNRIKETTFQLKFPEESIREHLSQGNKKELVNMINNGASA